MIDSIPSTRLDYMASIPPSNLLPTAGTAAFSMEEAPSPPLPMEQEPDSSLLLFTIDVAGGHLSAADAFESNVKAHNPTVQIERIELYSALMGKRIARLFAALWNEPQRREWIGLLSLLQRLQPLCDLLFYLPLLLFTFLRLQRSSASSIVSTQPLGSYALAHAARLSHWWHGRRVQVHLFLTEESAQCRHYFRPLKYLSARDRSIFTLHAPVPVLHEGDEERFWKDHTGLSLLDGEVLHAPPLVRPGFWQATARPQMGPSILSHQLSPCLDQKELELWLIPDLQKLEGATVSTRILPDTRIVLVMLAKEAGHAATLEYVEAFVRLFSSPEKKPTTLVYVACGTNQPLLTTLCRRLQEFRPLQAQGLHFVPLGYQTDRVIGQIMRFCDYTITKSGGITSLEIQVAAVEATHYIHAPSQCYDQKLQKIDRQKAAEQMVLHEWENFCALEKKCSAQLITPTALLSELSSGLLLAGD